MLKKIRVFLDITDFYDIARRYFVTNGFDGALTILGLILGFYFSGEADLGIVVSVCLSAATALGISGTTSAYISERAERRYDLNELEQAMVASLETSTHGGAARWIPWVIALVNGASPLVISLIILLPLLITSYGVPFPINPFHAAILLAFVSIFFIGVFLGRISGDFWFLAGFRVVLIAVFTTIIIFLISS